MKCPNCKDQKLQVTHVFSAGSSAETRSLRCPECGHKASSITFLVQRPQRGTGRGAWALSKQIRSGKLENPAQDDG